MAVGAAWSAARCAGLRQSRQLSEKGNLGKLMDGQSVERLMDIILQMKINLAHINETLHQQTYEIRQQLGAVYEDEKKSLDRCLAGIDEKLKECAVSINDYRQLYATLSGMRAKLVQLGGDPSFLPDAMPAESIDSVLAWRIHDLKDQGKL